MAYQISSIDYAGYRYTVGNNIRVSNDIMYTSITRPSGNTINMLSQCVMQITEIWAGDSGGSPVINPIKLKWVSGPSGSVNGGGFIRPEQIVPGSGGTQLSHTVTYDANGGEGAPAPQKKIWGEVLTLSSQVPTFLGWTFRLWNNARDGSGSGNYRPGDLYGADEDITLYAQWDRVRVTLRYNANGGSGSMADTIMEHGIPTALRKCTFTRPGYKFIGWHLYRDYDNTWYGYDASEELGWHPKNEIVTYALYEDERVLTGPSPYGGIVIFYAQWKMTTSLYEYENGKWVPKSPYIYTGGKWSKANAYTYNNGTWKKGSGA